MVLISSKYTSARISVPMNQYGAVRVNQEVYLKTCKDTCIASKVTSLIYTVSGCQSPVQEAPQAQNGGLSSGQEPRGAQPEN